MDADSYDTERVIFHGEGDTKKMQILEVNKIISENKNDPSLIYSVLIRDGRVLLFNVRKEQSTEFDRLIENIEDDENAFELLTVGLRIKGLMEKDEQ